MLLGRLGIVGVTLYLRGLSRATRRKHSWSLHHGRVPPRPLSVSALASGPVDCGQLAKAAVRTSRGWRLLGSEEVSQGDRG